MILKPLNKFIEGKSRLGCQVQLWKQHDGIVVHLLQND